MDKRLKWSAGITLVVLLGLINYAGYNSQDGFEFLGAVYLTLVILGLIILIFGINTLIRMLNMKKPKDFVNKMAVRIGKYSLIVAFIFLLHFWLAGGPARGRVLVVWGNNYFEPQLSALLIIVGFVTYFILKVRKK